MKLNFLLPTLVFLSIISRYISSLFFLLLSGLGIIYIIKKDLNKNDYFWLIFIILESLLTIFFLPITIKSFYLEGKYLLFYPAGIIMKSLCKQYIKEENYNFYKILIIILGFYMLVFSGFNLRFNGGGNLPLLNSVWIPTYSLAIMNILLQENLAYDNFLNKILWIKFFISSVVANTSAIIFVFIRNNLLTNIKKLFLKFQINKKLLYIIPITLIFSYYLIYIYLFRRINIFSEINRINDFEILLNIDRVGFYYSYIKTYLTNLIDVKNLINLLFGNGIGTSVGDWIYNLPSPFQRANLVFQEYINDTALIFQIEFLRVLYSYGLIGLLLIIITLKNLFSIENKLIKSDKTPKNNKKLIISHNLIWGLLITSIITINLSTSANFLSLTFTVFASQKILKLNK